MRNRCRCEAYGRKISRSKSTSQSKVGSGDGKGRKHGSHGLGLRLIGREDACLVADGLNEPWLNSIPSSDLNKAAPVRIQGRDES